MKKNSEKGKLNQPEIKNEAFTGNEGLNQQEIQPGAPAGREKKKFSLKNLKFYKSKKFHVILIIVLSVLLVLDLAFGMFFKFTTSFAGMAMGNFGSFDISTDTDTDTLSDDTASDDSSSSDSGMSAMPDMGSGDMPGADVSSDDTASDGTSSDDTSPDDTSSDDASSDGTSSDDRSSDSDGLPSAGGSADMGDLPSGDISDSDSAFGGFSEDSSDVSGDISDDFSADTALTSASGGSFKTWLGSYFLIIAVILALLDIAAIVNLIVFSKRAKREAKAALKARAEEEGRIYIEHGPAKKEKNAKTAWIIPLVVVIAIILVVNLISSGSSSSVAQTQASDLSGTVETGTIDTTIPGTGTLEEEDAVETSLADGVTVTKWYVSNGDSVSEGDTVAKVDKVSVLSAIATVQEAIEALDEEIASHEDDSLSDTITAAAAGRVMAVYASEDTSVVDVMYSYGALMVISLDGLMAVDIETDSLSTGDTVTVTLSDGTEEEGTVESTANSTAVITLTDDGPEIDGEVTVYDSDGNEIGQGTLYVHSALNVTGFSGTVSSVDVSAGDEVSSGDTLLELEDTDYTAEYDALVEQRQELSEQISELFVLYATGYLYAECDGIISGVDESLTEDSDDSSEDSEDTEDSDDTGDSDDTADADATSYDAAAQAITVNTVNAALTLKSTSQETEDSSEENTDEEENDEDSVIVGYILSVTENSSSDDGTETEDAQEETETESITVTLSTLDGETKTVEITSERYIYTYGESFEQTDLSSVTEGSIMFYVSDETLPIYVFSLASSSDDTDTGDTDTGDTGSDDTDYSAAQDSEGTSSSGTDDSGAESMQQGSDSEETMSTDTQGTDTSQMSDSSQADTSSDLTADASSTQGDVSTTQESVETTYSVSETTLCSITPQDYMTVTITVDELDILSLEVGQSAVVTLDAYTGQSFSGEVISVSLSPENSGGNSKYSAVIQIERSEDMLSGMNASVNITIESAEDVLIVPVAALFEEDGAVYIYTSFDEKNGTYSGAVEVTLGASDGEYVEITDGLSEGDTYYYSYLDTVNYSSTIISGSSGTIDFSSFMQQ